MTGSFQKWIVIGVIVLNTYSFGTNCVERFVNYQSWPKLADADFGPYHRAQQPWIFGFIVAPLAVGLLLQVLLLSNRPGNVPSWIVLMTIAATAVGFVSTFAIQVPIHRQLDHGYSQQLVAKLLTTDWIRKSADLVRLVATIALLQRVVA